MFFCGSKFIAGHCQKKHPFPTTEGLLSEFIRQVLTIFSVQTKSMFKSIDPEVTGGLGKDTKLDATVHPPIVYQLHYEFQGWLRNDILESFPCFIVTSALKEAILNAQLSGVAFDYVKVTTSYEFRQLYPAVTLPPFNWMKIIGTAGIDDFGISDKLQLIISEKAYNVLARFNISDAEINDYQGN